MPGSRGRRRAVGDHIDGVVATTDSPDSAGTVADSRPVSVGRGPRRLIRSTRVVVRRGGPGGRHGEGDRGGGRRCGGGGAESTPAGAGRRVEPPPNAPPKAAAPNATAAMSEATMVATAMRRAPPADGAPAGDGAGRTGGRERRRSRRCPGASTGASASSGRTISAVLVADLRSVGSHGRRRPRGHEDPSRYSTDSLICAPSSCPIGDGDALPERSTGPAVVRRRANRTDGGVGIIGGAGRPRAVAPAGAAARPSDSGAPVRADNLIRPSGV